MGQLRCALIVRRNCQRILLHVSYGVADNKQMVRSDTKTLSHQLDLHRVNILSDWVKKLKIKNNNHQKKK